MNVEMYTALAQFRAWRDSQCGVLLSRSEGEETVTRPVVITAVGEDSILYSLSSEEHITLANLSHADFSIADASHVKISEHSEMRFRCVVSAVWPTGKSCMFLEIIAAPNSV